VCLLRPLVRRIASVGGRLLATRALGGRRLDAQPGDQLVDAGVGDLEDAVRERGRVGLRGRLPEHRPADLRLDAAADGAELRLGGGRGEEQEEGAGEKARAAWKHGHGERAGEGWSGRADGRAHRRTSSTRRSGPESSAATGRVAPKPADVNRRASIRGRGCRRTTCSTSSAPRERT
jgi:hypothetical protein